MKKFKVLVNVTKTEEYHVEAENEAEAKETYYDGVYIDSTDSDVEAIEAEEINA